MDSPALADIVPKTKLIIPHRRAPVSSGKGQWLASISTNNKFEVLPWFVMDDSCDKLEATIWALARDVEMLRKENRRLRETVTLPKKGLRTTLILLRSERGKKDASVWRR